MVKPKEVFDYEFDEYELFVWMFSEHFQPGEFEYRLAEAVAAAGKRRQQGGMDVVAQAFNMTIHERRALQIAEFIRLDQDSAALS